MWAGTVEADDHPTPRDADSNGCGWPAATTITPGNDWVSGYYEVLLTINVDGKTRQSWVLSSLQQRPPPLTDHPPNHGSPYHHVRADDAGEAPRGVGHAVQRADAQRPTSCPI